MTWHAPRVSHDKIPKVIIEFGSHALDGIIRCKHGLPNVDLLKNLIGNLQISCEAYAFMLQVFRLNFVFLNFEF